MAHARAAPPRGRHAAARLSRHPLHLRTATGRPGRADPAASTGSPTAGVAHLAEVTRHDCERLPGPPAVTSSTTTGTWPASGDAGHPAGCRPDDRRPLTTGICSPRPRHRPACAPGAARSPDDGRRNALRDRPEQDTRPWRMRCCDPLLAAATVLGATRSARTPSSSPGRSPTPTANGRSGTATSRRHRRLPIDGVHPRCWPSYEQPPASRCRSLAEHLDPQAARRRAGRRKIRCSPDRHSDPGSTGRFHASSIDGTGCRTCVAESRLRCSVVGAESNPSCRDAAARRPLTTTASQIAWTVPMGRERSRRRYRHRPHRRDLPLGRPVRDAVSELMELKAGCCGQPERHGPAAGALSAGQPLDQGAAVRRRSTTSGSSSTRLPARPRCSNNSTDTAPGSACSPGRSNTATSAVTALRELGQRRSTATASASPRSRTARSTRGPCGALSPLESPTARAG